MTKTSPAQPRNCISPSPRSASSSSKLEKELGVLLFQRNTNSVDLTYAGSIFIEQAQKILDMVEQLRRRWTTSRRCAKDG